MTVAALVARGTQLARSAMKHPDGPTRSAVMRELGETLVSLRAEFQTEAGAPDWGGRTARYRAAVTVLYANTGLSPTDVKRLQASARYHVGNVLREVAPPAELRVAGLQPASPSDRVRAHHRATAALARAARVKPGDGLAVVLPHVLELLEAVEPSALGRLDAAETAELRRRLERIESRSRALLAAARAASAQRPQDGHRPG